MAEPLDVFLDTSKPIELLQDHLSKIIGHRLERHNHYGECIYIGRMLDIDIRLIRASGMEDDSGIAFSKYNYEISMIPFRSGLCVEGFEEMHEGVAKFLAAKLASELDCRSIVVANLQHRLASFGPEER